MATIYIIKGPDDGDAYTIGEEPITIGRGDECSITLNDEKSSRMHVEITFDSKAGGHVAEDLKSTNGTWCNGKSMHSAQSLNHGSTLELGGTILEYSERTFDTNEEAKESRRHMKESGTHHTVMDETNRPF
jgi:pSer/pThr/pTyr-binding forkhead associated (FHA) protein